MWTVATSVRVLPKCQPSGIRAVCVPRNFKTEHGNGNEERKALEVFYKFIDNTNLQFLKLENEMKK